MIHIYIYIYIRSTYIYIYIYTYTYTDIHSHRGLRDKTPPCPRLPLCIWFGVWGLWCGVHARSHIKGVKLPPVPAFSFHSCG